VRQSWLRLSEVLSGTVVVPARPAAAIIAPAISGCTSRSRLLPCRIRRPSIHEAAALRQEVCAQIGARTFSAMVCANAASLTSCAPSPLRRTTL
jgi:hypothetical protein